jgi:hypothetical protein
LPFVEGQDRKRHIFYRVKYDLEEENALMEAKQELKRLRIKHGYV